MDLDYQELINEGSAYVAAGKYDLALDKFRSAAELAPKNDTEIYTHLANCYIGLDRYSEAIHTFKTLLMLKPGDGETYFSLGGTCLLKGDIRDAVAYFNKAEEFGYKSVEMYIIMASLFSSSDDNFQAVRCLSKAIELMPLNAELYTRKAVLQLECGLEDDAVSTLSELKSLIPDAFEGYEITARIYIQRQELDKAEEVIKEAIERFPADPACSCLQLELLMEKEQYDSAIRLADTILSMKELDEPAMQEAVLYKATALIAKDDPAALINTLEGYKNLSRDPKACFMLMNAYLAVGNNAKLMDTADLLYQCADNNGLKAAGLFYKANALQRSGRFQEAKAKFAEISPILRKLSIDSPTEIEIYMYRILSYTELGEYEKAISICDYLLNAYPEMAEGHMYKLHVYKRMGKTELARAERNAALQINPDLVLEQL